MKKNLIVLCLALAMISALPGCSKNTENEDQKAAPSLTATPTPEVADPTEDTSKKEYTTYNGKTYETITVSSDLLSYSTFEELEENAAYVVIGEFISDETSVITKGELPQSSQKGEHVIDWYCYNQFRITEVLKGDLEADDVIEITGLYAFDDETDTMYTVDTGLYPMNNGGKYIYFLREKGTDGRYCACGDPSGRYPYMEIDPDVLEKDGYTAEELGVKSAAVFRYQLYPIYKELVEHYQITFE